MRGKLFASGSALLLSTGIALAQTPTGGPSPTPTPPPPIYTSDSTIVNTVTSGNQRRASVATGIDGSYLVVWNSDAAQAGFYDIKAQLFSHEGVMIGSEFQVDEGGPNRLMYTPDVAADGVGNYVVVWADFNQTVTDSEIWMRRYDGDANPLAGAIQVNTYTPERQRVPRVAADPLGQFVVVWESVGQDGSGLGVFGQRYDETGAPVGTEFTVNTYTTADQDRPSVDMDAAGFTVVFNDGTSGIAAREFGAFLELGSPQFPVFGPNHRLADVARLEGTANTLYVAENASSGGVDGVRSENGVIQSPFPMAASGFNPRLARPLVVGNALASPGAPRGDISEAIDVVMTLMADFHVFCALYDVDPNNFLEEVVELFEFLDEGTIPDVSSGSDGQLSVVAQNNSNPGSDVYINRGGAPDPFGLLLLDDNGNGVVDPGENVGVGAILRNFRNDLPVSVNGLITLPAQLTAPETLIITDDTADYGTIPAGGTGDCQATGDCYGFLVTGSRPGVHWDEAFVETLNTGVHKTWLLHVGESFADVPTTNLFYAFIENLLHNGITAGGACGGYCPTDGVKRQQMAVFLIKSRFGASFVPPPATGTIFTDVPITNPFAAWIELLYLLGVTGGCSGGPPPAPIQFCPDAIVNRQQMAVFLLKTLLGSGYVPPAAAGIFQDLPPANPFAPWAEDLYNRQVTGGCVAVPLQYCPLNPTNRQQMAAFLVKTFGLLLYGP